MDTPVVVFNPTNPKFQEIKKVRQSSEYAQEIVETSKMFKAGQNGEREIRYLGIQAHQLPWN